MQNKAFDELNPEETFKKMTNLEMQKEISNLNEFHKIFFEST